MSLFDHQTHNPQFFVLQTTRPTASLSNLLKLISGKKEYKKRQVTKIISVQKYTELKPSIKQKCKPASWDDVLNHGTKQQKTEFDRAIDTSSPGIFV
jgi:hypothetical protein